MADNNSIKRLALLVGGGPAPGINGVISAVTIEAINRNIQVFGIQNGYHYLVDGRSDRMRRLSIAEVADQYWRGGSILGTSRTNPVEKLNVVLNVLRKVGIDALVSIGGDDTAFSASKIYQASQGAIKVAHVPKTIDNDLPLPGSAPTFGFETARHFGTYIVRNLNEDARTTSRWYIVVSMGRAAGLLALGIGKAAAATLTVIPEEFRGRTVTLDHLCDVILGSILKARAEKTYHGVAVLAEGLIESIGEAELTAAINEGELGRYGRVERDPHGHLRLGEIEFSRMIRDLLTSCVGEFGLKTRFIDKDLGYELRSADPIPFDIEYTRDLGFGAVQFLRSQRANEFGGVISFAEGTMVPIPFEDMINPDTGRMYSRQVDPDGERYESARSYMTRLEKQDFTDDMRMSRLAEASGMTTDAFRKRFEYLVRREPKSFHDLHIDPPTDM